MGQVNAEFRTFEAHFDVSLTLQVPTNFEEAQTHEFILANAKIMADSLPPGTVTTHFVDSVDVTPASTTSDEAPVEAGG